MGEAITVGIIISLVIVGIFVEMHRAQKKQRK